jgi:hypothetical protein
MVFNRLMKACTTILPDLWFLVHRMDHMGRAVA